MRIFNQIRFDNAKGDLFGGVTAAIIALPMALAFGVASGAGAEAGLRRREQPHQHGAVESG
ncbi:SulP family inorganic anion transporter, partial [Thiococcus pfennigii]|uniref:SulP family inorganic anion transporter n=1 Tax=Thiococcus pfennigii TaxID=1057 RepID=UPI001904F97C